MDNFLKQVYKWIKENRMLLPKERLVVGVSGGADSVCLLLTLLSLSDALGIAKEDIFVLHVNHMLRGQEADNDEKFVEDLCESLGVFFESAKVNVREYAKKEKLTFEEAGRILRYGEFYRLAEEKGCSRIAVAHNKNDLAETVLFHMLRGSALKGISGIPPVRTEKGKTVIRPLLHTERKEIEDYLQRQGQAYRTDASNDSLDYDRNKIRHIILPAMQEINSEAISHICRMAQEAAEYSRELKEEALFRYGSLECSQNRLVLEIERVLRLPRTLRRQLLYEALVAAAGKKKDISQKHIDLLEELLEKETGKKIMLPCGLCARKSYDRLIFEGEQAGKENVLEDFYFPIEGGCVCEIPGQGTFFAEIVEYVPQMEIPKKIYTKLVDYGKIKGNLCIRMPRDGDYIKIDREGKTKKLSRVFIDAKVDREKRKNWPVLACENEIIWIPGLRYNEDFRIEKETKKVLSLRYERKGE